MKKFIIVVVFAVFLGCGASLFAQQQSSSGSQSEFFCVTVSLEKISPYRKGYVLQYRKGTHGFAYTYLPNEWFTMSAGKGEIVALPAGKNWPYLSVYYKNGEFSHLRLYVHPVQSHETWGNIPLNVNIDDRFENVDTVQLSF